MQEVGATITALSAQTLRSSRIGGLSDLSSYAPNVDIKETVPGALPTVTMRGIGLDDFSTTSSPAAGVYIDEVPLSSPGLMSGDFMDLERIEALKGPQGTLYGRNTTAGALNVISAKPGKDFDALAKVGYGDYQTFDAEGMLNIPLSDRAQLRLNAKTIQQDKGYWKSTLLADGTPGERDIGSRDVWLGRVQLALQPIDDLSINLKLEGQRTRSEIGVPKNFGAFTPGAPFVPCAPVAAGHVDNTQCADAFGYQNPHSSPYRGDWAGQFPYSVDQINATSLINYDVGGFSLTSVTGYINFARFYHIDVDATPLRQFDYLENEAVRQFTQEFRVGKDTALVDLLGGAFVSWDHVLGDNSQPERPVAAAAVRRGRRLGQDHLQPDHPVGGPLRQRHLASAQRPRSGHRPSLHGRGAPLRGRHDVHRSLAAGRGQQYLHRRQDPRPQRHLESRPELADRSDDH